MQLGTVLRSLVRRWYLVLLGLILTLALCYQVQQATPEKYKSQASLVIMPSAQSVGEEGNPYLNLGGMGEALDILTRRLSSEEVRKQIAGEFPGSAYTAETDKGTSGAILLITSTSSNASDALGTTQAVMDEAPKLLGQMQEALNVPQTSRISTMTLLVDSKATPETKARTQILLISAAGGLGLTFVLVVLIDSILKTRTAHRKGTNAPSPGTGRKIPKRIQAAPETVPSRTVPALSPELTLSIAEAQPLRRKRQLRTKPQHNESLSDDELRPPVPASQRPS